MDLESLLALFIVWELLSRRLDTAGRTKVATSVPPATKRRLTRNLFVPGFQITSNPRHHKTTNVGRLVAVPRKV